MPTLAEQIAAANAKLTSLLETRAAPAEATREVTCAEALQLIGAELAKQDLSKERRTYLTSALQEVAKAMSFEGATDVGIKITIIENDPDKVTPASATGDITTVATSMPKPSVDGQNRKTLDLASMSSGTPVTNFSSTLAKAEAMQRLLLNKVELRKSKVTNKLDVIKSLFSITDDDLDGDPYALRWKIGELVSLLMDAAKLEQLTGGDIAKNAPEPEPPAAQVWPADMASAQFDEKAGIFKNQVPRWGRDSERA